MKATLPSHVLTASLCLCMAAAASDSETDYQKARDLFSAGRYGDALRMAQQFLKNEPDSGKARKLAGLAYFMTGNGRAALSELEQAVKLSPQDAESFYYLGRVYFTANNMPRALSGFDTAIKFDPASVRAHNHRGQALEGMARFAEAKTAYLTAIELESTQKVRSEWPFHNLGALLLQQGEAQEAVTYFRQALTRNPDLVPSKVKLAMALSLSDKFDDALALLEEALRLEPRSSVAHYQLARLLTKMGRPDEARGHFLTFQQLQAQ